MIGAALGAPAVGVAAAPSRRARWALVAGGVIAAIAVIAVAAAAGGEQPAATAGDPAIVGREEQGDDTASGSAAGDDDTQPGAAIAGDDDQADADTAADVGEEPARDEPREPADARGPVDDDGSGAPSGGDAAPSDDPVAAIVTRAEQLATSRRTGAAIDALIAARKRYPKDARLPYLAGKLYFGRLWFADGLKQLRAAIALDPAYRRDPALIKAVIAGFNSTTKVDWTLARFLRTEIGAAAKPYLEEVARSHANPIVRNRARAELRHYR